MSIDNITCGILIVYNNSILLVQEKDNNKFSIPKGHIEKGEKKIDCAIREVREETSIIVNKNKLGEIYKLKRSKGRTLYYYVYELKDLKEIGLKGKIINRNNLPKKEISWAGFISFKNAINMIKKYQIEILDKYINDNKSKYIINYDNYFIKKKKIDRWTSTTSLKI